MQNNRQHRPGDAVFLLSQKSHASMILNLAALTDAINRPRTGQCKRSAAMWLSDMKPEIRGRPLRRSRVASYRLEPLASLRRTLAFQ